MRFLLNFTCILVLFLVAGCTDSVQWHSRTGDNDHLGLDEQTCGRHADTQAGKQLERELAQPGAQDSGLGQDFIRMDARRLRNRLFERCMRAHGYEKQE